MPDINVGLTLPGEALLRVVEETLKLVRAVIEGQPAEVKKQIWEWYIEDMRALRKALGMPA